MINKVFFSNKIQIKKLKYKLNRNCSSKFTIEFIPFLNTLVFMNASSVLPYLVLEKSLHSGDFIAHAP